MRRLKLIPLLVLAAGSRVAADPLTADQAVKIALQHNSQVIQSNASVLDARSGMWSAYSGVLPHVSAGASRSGSLTRESSGNQVFGSFSIPSSSFNNEGYNGSYDVSGSWSLLNLSAWSSLSSARKGMQAAQLSQRATRADVVLGAKRQFYEVVKALHLAQVLTQSLRLSRDDERRVRALFEVGSVSKSDLLKARVRTSQSELDSLLAGHNVTVQRILLSEQLGLPENELGDVDSTLAPTTSTAPDPAALLTEARAARPDLRAAKLEVKAAELNLRAAHWSRLPNVSASGSYTPDSRRSSKLYTDIAPHDTASTSAFESKRNFSGQVSINLDIFDGFLMDARVASARSRLVRARETRDALLRNLESEVHQASLGYQEALERDGLARRTLESASENLNLVQQKYNVGSATILDLIDSQVQLQRAQSDLVSAMAAIRVAEATLDRVRGRAE